MEMNISERIRVLMRRKGLTQIALAERMQFSRQNLDKRLKRNSWTEDDLKRMADAMGCDLEIAFIDKQTGERY